MVGQMGRMVHIKRGPGFGKRFGRGLRTDSLEVDAVRCVDVVAECLEVLKAGQH